MKRADERAAFRLALLRLADHMRTFGECRLSLSGDTWAAMLMGISDLISAVDFAVETSASAQQHSRGGRDAIMSVNSLQGELRAWEQQISLLEQKHERILLEFESLSVSKLSKAEQRKRKDPKYHRDSAPFSVRTENCMKNEFGSDNWTAFDIIKMSESELLRTPNFGRKSLKEVTDWLSELGLELRK